MNDCIQARRGFLKSLGLAAGAGVLGNVRPASTAWLKGKPNILLILVDDLGWGDLSCSSAEDLKTPNIDRLVQSGMKFNNFYANCCVCSPSRAALLTGRFPELVGVPGVIRTKDENSWGYLAPDAVLLPDLLKKAGYNTSIIGKWHLGLKKPNIPTSRGFDLFHGWLGDMMEDYYKQTRHDINYMRLNEKTINTAGTHATELFTQWSIETLKQNVKSGKPFFQYLAYNAPHTPIQPPDDWLEKVKKREPGMTDKRAGLVALIEHLDHGIGQVLKALKNLGLEDKTLVIFSSDNGGLLNKGANNGLYRSGKTHVYEGGIRVPMCASWPGEIMPGTETDHRALIIDIFPTLLESRLNSCVK